MPSIRVANDLRYAAPPPDAGTMAGMILFTRQKRGRRAGPSQAQGRAIDVSSPAHPALVDTILVEEDACCRLVRGLDWWVYVSTPLGIECFPALAECLALGQGAGGLDAVLDGLERLGLVAFVAGCLRRGSLHFGRSLDGFPTLVFACEGDRLTIGDYRLGVALQLGDLRFSEVDRAQWCQNASVDPEGSFFEGVRRCFAGVRYRVSGGCLAPDRRRLMAPQSQVRGGDEPVRILTDGLRALYSTYGNRKLGLRLSGGADSRVLLVGLMDAVREGILRRDQVMCVSVLFPGFDCDESAAIRRLIELSGFEWVGIEATPDRVREAYRETLKLPTPPFSTSFMGWLCTQEARQRDVQVMLSGHGGDEVLCFHLTDVLGRSMPDRWRSRDLIRYLAGGGRLPPQLRELLWLILGRYGQRAHLRALIEARLPLASLAAHRFGRRMTLAQGCGYENAAITARSAGMLMDVPFLRGGFLGRLDPSAGIWARGYPFKPAAHDYLRAHAPEIERVERRKVTFDAVVRCLVPGGGHQDGLPLDRQQPVTQYAIQGYADWRACLHQTG